MRKRFALAIGVLGLMAFSLPAMAEMKIGGTLFTDVYYLDRDRLNAAFRREKKLNVPPSRVGDGSVSYTVTGIQVPDITRFYAKWTNEDQVGMYIELGLGQESDGMEKSDSAGVVLRHAYGWWDMGPSFRILAGKTTTPFSPLNPSQLLGSRSGSLNSVGVGYGDFYSGRIAQVRGTFHFSKYTRLAVALVDPNGTADEIGKDAWRDYLRIAASDDTKVPRIDIGLFMQIGPVLICPSFLYQHRAVDIPDNPGIDTSVDTCVGSLGFDLGIGQFSLSGEGNWGKNWGDTRGLIGNSPPGMLASAVIDPSGNIHNAETYSFWLDLCYQVGNVTPHLIYGEMKSKNLLPPRSDFPCEAKSTMWGFSIPIDLARGFRLRPECMWYNDGKRQDPEAGSVNYGKYAIYGVQLQISF